MENGGSTLETILRTSLMHEIQIAKTLLASYDIQSYIFDKNIDLVIGTAYVEGYKLKVSSLDFEKAKKILEEKNSTDNS
jgi:hypothetical protein